MIKYSEGCNYLREDGAVVHCVGVNNNGGARMQTSPGTYARLLRPYTWEYDSGGNCVDCTKELKDAYKILGPAMNEPVTPSKPTTAPLARADLGPAEQKMYDDLSEVGKKVFLERQAVYGSVVHSQEQIGRVWAAQLSTFTGKRMDDIPGYMVSLMMAAMKLQRATRVYHADNYVDGENYLKFADKMQEAE